MSAIEQRLRTIILSSADPKSEDWLREMLSAPKIEILAHVAQSNRAVELVKNQRPDLIIVDRGITEAETIIHQMTANSPSSVCVALVPNPDVPALRRLMAVGARDVLPSTTSYADLVVSIRQVMTAELERRGADRSSEPAAANNRGKLIVLIAPKGGVGTTTIATNLAIALKQVSGRDVALADFSLQFGDIGVHLNLRSKYAINDLSATASEMEEAMIKRVMSEHSSGVDVLLAPAEPDAAAEVTGTVVGNIIDHLLNRYSYVIADTWSFLDEVSETLLRRADEVLLVTTPELPTLKNAKRFLEFVTRNQLATGQITIVLNRFPSVEGISLKDVQEHLMYSVGANIPSEGQLVTHSINRGVPVILSHPKSWTSQSLSKLAARIAGGDINTISLNDATPTRSGDKQKSKSLQWPWRFSRDTAEPAA